MNELSLNGLLSPGTSWRLLTRSNAPPKSKNKRLKTSTKARVMHLTIKNSNNLVLMQMSMICTLNEEIHQPFLKATLSATLPMAIWQYSSIEHPVSLPSNLAIHKSPSFLRAQWNPNRKIQHKMRTARPIRPNQTPRSSLLRSRIWCWRITQPSST